MQLFRGVWVKMQPEEHTDQFRPSTSKGCTHGSRIRNAKMVTCSGCGIMKARDTWIYLLAFHVTEAAKKQLDTLWHTTNIYYHPTIHEFAELMVCYFVNSGTEANDMAIMMARAHTGSYDMLSLRNGYHGTSPGTLGVLAHSTWKLNVPVNFGFFQVCEQ
ncbi:Alanine--glyoxylate aminotransferase 2 [Acropora cervicornis]|uniref:Alanine--glyoxylate aminotransferase 2, mitochondrial n=1 Tax=Acropora cervicornis TaxID=6130 RepID=A0AAD9VF66_ACRCE|nr:Alanine--glyoxylate aminotransferase 2 [Acropora cervicornis]